MIDKKKEDEEFIRLCNEALDRRIPMSSAKPFTREQWEETVKMINEWDEYGR